MNLINWTISFAMVGLFIIAIIGFALNFESENDAAVGLSSDSEISSLYTDTKGNMEGFSSDSGDTYTTLMNSSINPTAQTYTSTAPFSITSKNAQAVAKSGIDIAFNKLFGGNSNLQIFLLTFLGLIALISGFLIFKALKGEPG